MNLSESDYLYSRLTWADYLAARLRPQKARERAERRAKMQRTLSRCLTGRVDRAVNPRCGEVA